MDELQGYMGYIYAKAQGEEEEVALAIYEQYLNKPTSLLGSILSLADKIDNLVLLIRAGEVPRGSSDPYGLRRQAFGIFSILEENSWDIDLRKLLEEFYGGVDKPVEEFIKARLEAYLEPYRYDTVRAVLEVFDPLRPYRCIALAKRIAELREEPKFKELVGAYKRVVKILPKDWRDKKVEEGKLREKEEVKLWEKIRELKSAKDVLDLYPLKEAIDNFFDKVLVMEKDEELRRNRLALLLNVKEVFNRFGDFSKLVYEEV